MSDERKELPLERLLEENLPRLRAYIRLRTNNQIRARESCSDLVQSVCRELIEQRDDFEFQGDAAFRNWLYTAALRKVVERARHWNAAKRDVGRELAPQADDLPVVDAYATVTTPSLLARRREDLSAFEAAFDDLTEEHREVVTLAKLVGLSHAEIAVEMGRTEEACRQLLRRALVRLELALERRGLGGE